MPNPSKKPLDEIAQVKRDLGSESLPRHTEHLIRKNLHSHSQAASSATVAAAGTGRNWDAQLRAIEQRKVHEINCLLRIVLLKLQPVAAEERSEQWETRMDHEAKKILTMARLPQT